MKPNTKKDFHNTLKYGKAYALIKNHVDILCEAIINKLDGKYTIKYIAQQQLFIVSIYDVPAWSNLSLSDSPVYNRADDKTLFMTAHDFAAQHLNHINEVRWNTTNCQVSGKAEYHISYYW